MHSRARCVVFAVCLYLFRSSTSPIRRFFSRIVCLLSLRMNLEYRFAKCVSWKRKLTTFTASNIFFNSGEAYFEWRSRIYSRTLEALSSYASFHAVLSSNLASGFLIKHSSSVSRIKVRSFDKF